MENSRRVNYRRARARVYPIEFNYIHIRAASFSNKAPTRALLLVSADLRRRDVDVLYGYRDASVESLRFTNSKSGVRHSLGYQDLTANFL